MAGCAQNHTFDTKSSTVDTKGRGKILRFHFFIETDIFRQFQHKKCAADKEKTLSLGSTFTRCVPKTAQAKGLFETEIKEKNLKVSINLEVQTADKVKVSGQIFCKKPFQITRNMV